MTAVVWWAVAAAAVVVLACSRARDALARRRQARLRAEALLLAWLSPGQRAQYRARGWFEVTTAAGHRFRVRRGGVVRLDPRGSAYCIEAVSAVPVADEMLANKLLLETDERRFLATAHRYRYHRSAQERTEADPDGTGAGSAGWAPPYWQDSYARTATRSRDRTDSLTRVEETR
jgi:hypothetical protein